ncbi:calcineurin-like phosphoesterase family protein [Acidovorax delafieldii]|uniref:Calcineurin-like phosphoesterase family protein n=1 Tax=Acidovorax delafieldii TaxID=47920 RepID=A0A561XKA4_ACIDE|nr:metallophosphoesterase [Acidovorax delafieldii]TWG36548.1 calcineurin-like phosphoesterase family protein [Acidovorax delafieldii]
MGGKENFSNGINILHLSDLHVGVHSQSWLWPTLETEFFRDIRRLHGKTGNWDVVIFSGDLVQQAIGGEYSRLNEILKKIFSELKSLGSEPLFFPIPGNHDLQRPESMDPSVRAFKDWEEDGLLREAFWSKKPPQYFDCIAKAFENYKNWFEGLAEIGISTGDAKHGLLPGDISLRVPMGERHIGLVGLNSAWLQLRGGDYKGKLDVDIRQLLAVTDNQPDEWAAKNSSNVLVTHHPLDWLSHRSQSEWRSEIYLPHRFDAHMFGHMHDTALVSTSEGGSASRRFIQSASLFGLEEIANGTSRLHGYSVFRIEENNSRKCFRQWPRIAIKGQDGTLKIVPNFQMNIDHETGAVDFDFDSTAGDSKYAAVNLSEKIHSENSSGALQIIRKILPESAAHARVRKTEQAICIASLEQRHPVWISADWGQGSDEFLRSILIKTRLDTASVYQLDLQACYETSDIRVAVEEQIGVSFTKFFDLLSAELDCILLLADVPLNEGRDKEGKKLQGDVEQMCAMLLQYCPNLRIVVKSRIQPPSSTIKCVRLQALDLADTATYVSTHAAWARQGSQAALIAKLHRHTDGLPSRIDAALRNLQFTGTNELLSLDADVAGKRSSSDLAPQGLVDAIDELRMSPDPSVKRSFELLKALAQFPRGELLSSVKRFNGATPFFMQHAIILVESAFVDSVEVPNVGSEVAAEGSALVVKRLVRDYLTSILSATELKKLNTKAFSLYFGDNWSLKGISSKKGFKFDDRNLGAWRLGNASVLVLRYIRNALAGRRKAEEKKAIDLAGSFCAALMSGDRWSDIVSLCGDLMPIFDDYQVDVSDLWVINGLYAKALRMTGEAEKAKNIYVQLMGSKTSIPGPSRQEYLLNLAMCYERLEEKNKAMDAAKECMDISTKTSSGLQAKSIYVSIDDTEKNKDGKLLQLEMSARTKKHHNLASTLALARATRTTESNEKKKILQEIVDGNAVGNEYNIMRAMLQIAQIDDGEGHAMDVRDLNKLIEAYHYLYNETLPNLFDQCTAVLWKEFSRTEHNDNLFSLFRHSSLVWRLRDEKKMEIDYFRKLGKFIAENSEKLTVFTSREIAYFIARGGELTREIGNSGENPQEIS